MAKSSCKCKKSEECEECPEWIFTFADLVMLMMGFFVILWVLKPAPGKNAAAASDADKEWMEVVASIRGGFGWTPDSKSSDPIDRYITNKNRQIPPDMTHPHNGGETNQQKGVTGTDKSVTDIRQSQHYTEGGKMLFEAGSDHLNDATVGALSEFADQVRGYHNIVVIKGHTSLDDFPDKATDEQKMDLSVRRAQAAANFLTQHQVDPRLIRVQGCSVFEPLIRRDYSPGAQSRNRRIEVEATANLIDDLDDSGASRPSGKPGGH